MAQSEGPWGGPRPPTAPRSRVGLWLWLALLAIAGGGFWLLMRFFPARLSDSDWADAWRNFGILALASSGLVYARGLKASVIARNISIWVAVVAVLAVGYAYRGELMEAGRRVRAELVPAYAVRTGAHEMVLTQGEGGQFYVMGKVNGAPLRFVIDTGASDIVLSPDDAKRVGVPVETLDFARAYETANGVGRGAGWRAERLEVGPVAFKDIEVSINGAPMSASLLGMTFLRRLDSFEFRGNQLVLRWRG
jgi:aspartyl protease family protein